MESTFQTIHSLSRTCWSFFFELLSRNLELEMKHMRYVKEAYVLSIT